jgi:hypothetical protein
MVGYPRISSTDVDDVCGHVMPRVFVPADHGLLTPEGHEAPPASGRHPRGAMTPQFPRRQRRRWAMMRHHGCLKGLHGW